MCFELLAQADPCLVIHSRSAKFYAGKWVGNETQFSCKMFPKDSLTSENALATVTGRHSPPQRQAARHAGACGYVLKENLMAIRELLLETGQ